MSRPIALSDDELTAIMNAARPLAPRDRDRFLKQIAQAIARSPAALKITVSASRCPNLKAVKTYRHSRGRDLPAKVLRCPN
jgi:hypothetical protein